MTHNNLPTADEILNEIGKSIGDENGKNMEILDGIGNPRLKVERILEIHKRGMYYQNASYLFAKDLIIIFDNYRKIFASYGVILSDEYVKSFPPKFQGNRNNKVKNS